MANRNRRASIAAETVEILSRGSYTGASGTSVSIELALRNSVEGTQLYRPQLLVEVVAATPPASDSTRIDVRNCTTLSAARELHASYGSDRVLLLNFASARNPGGGFLGGSQAQEESLARASGLYASLRETTEYYEANRRERSALYTDHMIYSPLVPVFRDDDDHLIDDPWHVSMITAPAPNAGAVRSNEPENRERIVEVMRRRIGYVLALAAHHEHDALVLGAWGCGVFANDSREVAALFADQLLGEGRYARAFTEVVFAILDRTGNVIAPFADAFGRSPGMSP